MTNAEIPHSWMFEFTNAQEDIKIIAVHPDYPPRHVFLKDSPISELETIRGCLGHCIHDPASPEGHKEAIKKLIKEIDDMLSH